MANDNKNYVVLDIKNYNELLKNNEIIRRIEEIYYKYTCLTDNNLSLLSYDGEREIQNYLFAVDERIRQHVNHLIAEANKEEDTTNDK